MKHHEKKYRVDDFNQIDRKLKEVGAKKLKHTTSTHYYARQAGNDVVKLVKYSDRNEIHILQETGGTFVLKENISVKSTDAGLRWLKGKGYTKADIVTMAYTDYGYKNGIVGLYIINGFLHSVILDFPEQQHPTMEKELGLATAEVLSIPYNKYLERIGKVETLDF